jgi:dolichol-phosphate mannosyltransferase
MPAVPRGSTRKEGRGHTIGAVRTLVVLPTYNEAENIDEVLRRVRAALPDASVLVVDDASPDGTADLAEKLDAELGPIAVLRRPAKSGLGSAYRAGFRRGIAEGFEVMVEMDSDLSHDPAALPGMLATLERTGAGLVVGSRYIPGGSIPAWSWHRRMLSEWGNRYAAFVLGLDVRDATSGFRAYRAAALAELDLDLIRADGYGFQIEMAYAIRGLGHAVVEYPISFTDRLRGKSKMSSRIVVEAMRLVTWWAIRDRLLRRGNRHGQRT